MVIILFLSLIMLVGCSNVNKDQSKKALLIVSFGSSYNQSRKLSIDATENAISKAFPDYEKFTAFTSQKIIDVYKKRDNITYLNVEEAILKIYKRRFGEVLIVPTHVINGEEYDQMNEELAPFLDKFAKLTVSKALLTTMDDYSDVTEALIHELPELDDKTAVVFMGHGTPHFANSAYPTLDYVFKHKGFDNIYVGTVEGSPTFENVTQDIAKKDYEKILLIPLMIVAGDHANNDMAGDDVDSWKTLFKSKGYTVDYILKGMGELNSIRELIIKHAKVALAEEEV